MSFKEIVELIERINNSQISLMELNYQDLYLKLDKSLNRSDTSFNKPLENTTQIASTEHVIIDNPERNISKSQDVSVEVEEVCDDQNVDYVTSPMVGTVYLSSAPGNPPYVSKGSTISQGDIVCIIEAMKLMNEIESEFSGEIVEVLVENAQMVEFGQKLFKVKKN